MTMTPQELNAIKDLTKAINGLTKVLNRKPVVPGQTIYADNQPYLTVPEAKNNEGTLRLVRNILDDQGADQNITNGIIRALEDAGIVFREAKDLGDET